jgi:DNA-binding response OmpR family regulator
LRVLIVEDEVRLAQNLGEALREGAGFAIDHAGDGIEGEHLALNGHYDAIILDLMLPGQDGMSMLLHLRDRKNMTPVLICSLSAFSTKQAELPASATKSLSVSRMLPRQRIGGCLSGLRQSDRSRLQRSRAGK